MIRVHKPHRGPVVLSIRGKQQRRLNSQRFTLMEADYRAGRLKFEFDAKLYGDPSVKGALIQAQHGKCCFCESKILHISYGDVEHFRPKAAWCQSAGDSLQRPGYYWLAYEWSNLFLACQNCNQRHKRNLFPLEDPTRRVTSHRGAALLGGEATLFIDPGMDDPEQYIGFRDEVPYPKDGPRSRGQATIDGLRRPALSARRRERLSDVESQVEMLRIIAKRYQTDPELLSLARYASRRLARWSLDAEEYASMVREKLREELVGVVFPLEPDSLYRGFMRV